MAHDARSILIPGHMEIIEHKARELVRSVIGTTAIEGQTLTQDGIDKLVQQAIESLHSKAITKIDGRPDD